MAVPPDPPIVAAVRSGLAPHARAANAVAQQRYMKSAMPYRGITSPDLKQILRGIFAAGPLPASRAEWERAVLALYDGASFREERYAALALAAHRSARGWQDASTLPHYRHLISTGAWWDLVDTCTSSCVSPILLAHRDLATPVMREWSVADDMWLRRASIISQLPHKAATDRSLLTEAIEANVEGTAYGSQFFIRKAIGWALRQYARIDPQWVRGFVDTHAEQLSGLSVREATKHL